MKKVFIKDLNQFMHAWHKEQGLISFTLASKVLKCTAGRIQYLVQNDFLNVFIYEKTKMLSMNEIEEIRNIDKTKIKMKASKKRLPWNKKISEY